MNYYQELKKYLNNNLFTSYSLEIDFPKIYNFNANQKAFRDILTKITKIYDKNNVGGKIKFPFGKIKLP
ncbi:hypothetical protein JKV22_001284 [Campylobacter jejuni]|nr:hypothetical protein [Campylobacter jejuni]